MEENSVSFDVPKSNSLLVPIKDVDRVSEQRPPFLPQQPNAERPGPAQEKPLPQFIIESNMLVGDSINIIDTDQPVRSEEEPKNDCQQLILAI